MLKFMNTKNSKFKCVEKNLIKVKILFQNSENKFTDFMLVN